jgi:hypothetical protein
MLASITQRRELLAGLLDTDGTASRGPSGGSSRVSFTSALRPFAEQVIELARSLGFKATLRGADRSWQVAFTARGETFRLPRKQARLRADGATARTRHLSVVGVEEVGTADVRCITVDSPDGTYLVGRAYRVTHNTQQMAIGRTLWKLGRDPSRRIAVISNTFGQAQKIVRTIAQYIERPGIIHEIFPNLRRGEPWTANMLTVKRETTSKDPSVQACGVHGNITGARLEDILGDDLLDFENTRTHALRQDLADWFNATLVGRLTNNGTIYVIGTAFHPDDLLHRFVHPG